MKISLCPKYNFSFKSNDRVVYRDFNNQICSDDKNNLTLEQKDNLIYSNFTLFFRPDLNSAHSSKYSTVGNWVGFRKTIVDEFKNVSKVNVYDFACSDGSEAYSLILSLVDELGEEEAKKFFPILAYDVDETMVESAKNGSISCYEDDIDRLAQNIHNDTLKSYYGINFDTLKYPPYTFLASDKLKKNVDFNTASIQEKIAQIEPSNSLVLCRNFFPYLGTKDMLEVIWQLGKKLDDTSLLVIGHFDKFKVYNALKACGFREIYPFVFKKEKAQ